MAAEIINERGVMIAPETREFSAVDISGEGSERFGVGVVCGIIIGVVGGLWLVTSGQNADMHYELWNQVFGTVMSAATGGIIGGTLLLLEVNFSISSKAAFLWGSSKYFLAGSNVLTNHSATAVFKS